jgi:hypothetical protein
MNTYATTLSLLHSETFSDALVGRWENLLQAL